MSVRIYIREQLAALGEVKEHPFQQGPEAGTNLILRLPGQPSQLDPLLIGADDNATGVAALLELAGRCGGVDRGFRSGDPCDREAERTALKRR